MRDNPATDALRVRPFLKWAGGKSWLVPELLSLIGKPNGTYFEPFLGAGAVFLALDGQVKKHGSDINAELINTWVQVRENLTELINVLKTFENSEEFYMKIRAWDRDKEVFARRPPEERAARMIFLNKTCFNGLYRVNSRGEFNVPWGKNLKANFLDEASLAIARNALIGNQALELESPKLSVGDYGATVRSSGEGDVIYFDPPYEPLTATSSFVSYQRTGFTSQDQVALRDFAKAAMERGSKVIVSNSSAQLIDELYRPEMGFEKIRVNSARAISASTTGRKKVVEYLIVGEPK